MNYRYKRCFAQMMFRRSQPGIASEARRATATRIDFCYCCRAETTQLKILWSRSFATGNNCLINKLLMKLLKIETISVPSKLLMKTAKNRNYERSFECFVKDRFPPFRFHVVSNPSFLYQSNDRLRSVCPFPYLFLLSRASLSRTPALVT